MSYNLSGCVFIRDSIKGAFCLFESMHQLLPLCDEFIIMDLGSTDGTLELLEEIAQSNSKIKIVSGNLYKNDASIFAILANEVIAQCQYDHVLYYQADEIWHEKLIDLTKDALDKGERNLSFWRYQLKHNFQKIKWFPHPVHRIAPKNKFNFTNDGMNTDKVFDTTMVSNYGLGAFTQWGDKYKNKPVALPTDEMILDVSLTGGFLHNIPDRRRMHLPFWNEGDVMPADEGGLSVDNWYSQEQGNSAWGLRSTEFNIPQIMHYHVGMLRYHLRPQLFESLKRMGEQWR